MNIIITRALNMEFEEKDLAAKVFHGKKDKLLYINTSVNFYRKIKS